MVLGLGTGSTAIHALDCIAHLSGWTWVVVEKPFGKDPSSVEDLSWQLGELFSEEQLYRINHYLGKELLQNLMESMECRGSVHRIKQCADDLLVSMEDVLVDEDDHKKNLTDLANNFFCIDEAKLVLFQLASEFLPMINEVARVLLTLPHSFSQLGMASGITFQPFYYLMGSWTAYFISILYVQYRTRKEREKVAFRSHVIQTLKKESCGEFEESLTDVIKCMHEPAKYYMYKFNEDLM
ncbi:hypothetical protein J5N97_013413 [Dioscorea zingiberensis]|uniref:glucose-6-phosphate dehydrogenase (NADP(+)) n=1 Tax=Dioscorea zingiberensis TaxID=325984 RepID=A0A9D5CS59_9LILI|nr:hypothetical protein J5N97_013413 [Dioscorea zingiberensis]